MHETEIAQDDFSFHNFLLPQMRKITVGAVKTDVCGTLPLDFVVTRMVEGGSFVRHCWR